MKRELKLTIAGLTLVSVFAFSSCGGDKKKKTDDDNTTQEPIVVEPKGSTLKIGYYNVDSLNEQYVLVKEVSKDIEAKVKKMSDKFEAEVKSFEKWAGDMEKKMKDGLLLSSEEKKFMEQFQKRQYELGQKEQKLAMEVQNMQGDNLLKATNRVNDFVKRYAEENGFDMILQYQLGGQITYINESFDVTNDIISGLNKEYKEIKNDLK